MTIPPLVAARLLGIPVVLHEQNAVMGRANRMLARLASAIGTGFPSVAQLPAGLVTTHVGNPVRPQVLAAREVSYQPAMEGQPIRLLVFGGSQGARIMSEVVPEAVRLLPSDLRGQLHVTQQARPEDIDGVRKAYAEAGVSAELASFFDDMPARMALAHLVIARAG
ncbi:glycosyltransferase, partial [Hansschlegelia beijingensis]